MTPTPAADEPLIYELVDLSLALADHTQALVQDVMSELNLTPTLANALWHLGACAPDPPMSKLAARLRRDPSTITFLADRLQERGLLVRDVDPQNRRTKILHLTDAGRITRRALVEAMATRSPIAHLSDKDQRHLHDLLARAMAAPP
ncbi:MarR family winged helix-turn-helix transcriptional regulator [Jatrophihabitans lederbergiae]|uniref:MarR family transcriptional regulator n=1 Tax=Jatrophihabitans lederbergiae TaxID=3075547 RepID=A0ABU2JIT5_9ACTN|nr:MarR family transcriptional regulator [Jatrophihabitans sp. DSM 44399]MDT0264158.1 MarR family transcriptional regulator [Jatrophihabitans sp. DSM 44399]